jgi:type IV pilus assembly protein PilX
MPEYVFSRRFSSHRQDGAALVVSLILLLVMTVIGVGSMGVAVTEIKMATTMQQEEVALRRAERTLLIAENAIETIVNASTPYEFTTAGDAYYVYDPNDAVDPRSADWSGISSMAGPVSTPSDNLDNDDAYITEYQGSRVIPGEAEPGSPDAPVSGGLAYIFRNTTRSASGKNAVRIVESVYATFESP